jgi:hypothetical protein
MMIAELLFLAHTLFPHHHHDFEDSILLLESDNSRAHNELALLNICSNHDHAQNQNQNKENDSKDNHDCHISDLSIVLNNHDNIFEQINFQKSDIAIQLFAIDAEGVIANSIKLETKNKDSDYKDDILLENNSLRAPPIC